MMLAAFSEAVTTVATVRLRHRLCLMRQGVLSVRRELICEARCMEILTYLLTYLLTHLLHGAESFLRS